MAESIYLLCALTSLGCALLLLRQYHRTRTRLLAWSSACFGGLAVNNLLLLLDLVLFPAEDMSLARNGVALLAIASLVVGLVWDTR